MRKIVSTKLDPFKVVKFGAAVVLTDQEVESWNGPYYFLPLIGVKKAKGKKLSFRVCFDASHHQAGYPSLNDCLRKGPDRFMNKLLSVQLCFYNGCVGLLLQWLCWMCCCYIEVLL